MLQRIVDFWPIVVMVAGGVGGLAVFYLNLLRIRELQGKLQEKKKNAEKNGTPIYLPTTAEITKYSEQPVKALKRARYTNFIIIILSVILIPSLYIYHSRIHYQPAAPQAQLVIQNLFNGETVGSSEIVKGNSQLPELNHYIVVIPLRTGDRWVVDGPIAINAEGNWSGRARFGELNVGVGEKFAVSVLATAVPLSEGQLVNLPDDVRMSDPVEVVRE